MKKIITYSQIFLLSLIIVFIFKVDKTEYIMIKYLFPRRVIFIMIAIMFNYLYTKLIFECMEKYLYINTFVIIRIGKKRLTYLVVRRIIFNIIIYTFFSLLLDILFFNRIFIYELIYGLILNIFIGFILIKSFKQFNNLNFILSFILMLLIKIILTIFL